MTDKNYTQEFYKMFAGKTLVVVRTPPVFPELKPGDEVIIANPEIVGEHITNANSYVDIFHTPGIPRLSKRTIELLPSDYLMTQKKYEKTLENREPLGLTNWQLYDMNDSIQVKELIFVSSHNKFSKWLDGFVQGLDEEEDEDWHS